MSDENQELKDQRVVTMMSPSELEAIDDWMFRNRLRSRAEAIRHLCRLGMTHALAHEANITKQKHERGKVLVEVSGPKGSGKSAIISEIAQTLSRRGLNVRFADEAGYGATLDPASAINLLRVHRPTVLLIEHDGGGDVAEIGGDHG